MVTTIFFEGPGLSGKRSAVQAIGRQFGLFLGSSSKLRVTFNAGSEVTDFELSYATWGLSRLDDTPELAERRRLEAGQRVSEATVIAFVIDSQRLRKTANDEAFERLREDLARHGRPFGSAPIVFLLNKRDLPDAVPAAELRQRFASPLCAHLETVACSGIGLERFLPTVIETLARVKGG